ncbi:MAG: hypothetical protein ACRD7E_14390 [Bryobacteraceae bacterium]
MMKTTELRYFDNSSGVCDLPRKGTLLVEAQMGSGTVVVIEIPCQRFLEVTRIQDHKVVQALSSDGAD